MGLVVTALKSLWGAQPAQSSKAADQLEQRINFVILPSRGAAADNERGMAK
jgi:hypothetical protein